MTYETFSTIHEVIKTKGIHLSAILDQENKAPKIHREHYRLGCMCAIVHVLKSLNLHDEFSLI